MAEHKHGCKVVHDAVEALRGYSTCRACAMEAEAFVAECGAMDAKGFEGLKRSNNHLSDAQQRYELDKKIFAALGPLKGESCTEQTIAKAQAIVDKLFPEVGIKMSSDEGLDMLVVGYNFEDKPKLHPGQKELMIEEEAGRG